MKKCYIAGKIGDLPEEQYKKNFEQAKEEVRALGYEPISPVDLPHMHDRSWKSYMLEDLLSLLTCDCVYAQSNWDNSKGATIEVNLALSLGIQVIYQLDDMLSKITREELILLCQDAVVHHTKWTDRDSLSSQKTIRDIYKGLTAGLDFRIVTKEMDSYHSNENTIIIEFLQPIDFDKLKTGKDLTISSREDYFKDCDPEFETEMFDDAGINFDSTFTKAYMPTRKRITEADGKDWY